MADQRNVRDTQQKRAIRGAFARATRPLSTQEVLREAQAGASGLGIATVYRSIRSLVEEGWLIAVELPGRGAWYEVADKSHHHHFACSNCGRVYDIEGCVDESPLRLPRGFRADYHETTVVGTCAECAAGSH